MTLKTFSEGISCGEDLGTEPYQDPTLADISAWKRMTKPEDIQTIPTRYRSFRQEAILRAAGIKTPERKDPIRVRGWKPKPRAIPTDPEGHLIDSPQSLRARGVIIDPSYVARWNREQREKILKREGERKSVENAIVSLASGKDPGRYPVYSGSTKIGTLLIWKSGKFLEHKYSGKTIEPRMLPLRIPPMAKMGEYYHPLRGWY